MAACSDVVSSLPPSLHAAAPLPTLPSDLVEEILCRLPVKILLQLQCICKSWKSLISNDRNFAKKHMLRMSKKHLIVNSVNDSGEQLLWDSPIPSLFTNVPNSTVTQTQLNCPFSISGMFRETCSCDGILCFTISGHPAAVLWNPTIRRYNILPPLEFEEIPSSFYSFGYDRFNGVYKVVAISFLNFKHYEINVHTLGTNSWRRIQHFKYLVFMQAPGVFVSDTVNWLAYDVSSNSFMGCIVSVDLENESYQKLSFPDFRDGDGFLILGMFRDCLCIFESRDKFLDVWVMKEYGKKESWTKLYSVPFVENPGVFPSTMAVYISEDHQLLIDYHEFKGSRLKLAIYDSKNGTLMIPEIQNINGRMDPKVYIESLISPCS